MRLEIDPDVQAVAEFMQRNVPAARLVSVAEAAAKLAPILWGGYEKEGVSALLLREMPIRPCDSRTQPFSSGSPLGTASAGDCSAEADI